MVGGTPIPFQTTDPDSEKVLGLTVIKRGASTCAGGQLSTHLNFLSDRLQDACNEHHETWSGS